jgi:hypothetical protein
MYGENNIQKTECKLQKVHDTQFENVTAEQFRNDTNKLCKIAFTDKWKSKLISGNACYQSVQNLSLSVSDLKHTNSYTHVCAFSLYKLHNTKMLQPMLCCMGNVVGKLSPKIIPYLSDSFISRRRKLSAVDISLLQCKYKCWYVYWLQKYRIQADRDMHIKLQNVNWHRIVMFCVVPIVNHNASPVIFTTITNLWTTTEIPGFNSDAWGDQNSW